MGNSPYSKPLYRMARGFVICAAAVLFFQGLSPAQSSSQKKDRGPRALALLELSPNGTAHLVPVAIMYNGDFFDASAYKANPVPMALESGTVYEAVRTGSSQGLFTVKLASQTGSNWIGTGTWQDSAALAAAAERRKKQKEAAEKPPAPDDDDSGPPKLLRRSSTKSDSKQPEAKQPTSPSSTSEPSKPGTQTASAPPSSEPQKPGTQPAKPETTPSASDKSSAPSQSSSTQASPGGSPDENDPDRPRLERRDQPSPTSHETMTSATSQPTGTSVVPGKPAALKSGGTTAATVPSASAVQEIPAVSDAGGPDPRSYIFPLKPGEDAEFHKKMLAQATKALQSQLKSSPDQTVRPIGHSASRTKTAKSVHALDFQQVQLRFFDLSSSNQPLMVLEATVQLPDRPLPQHITLITRQDINGDLHNALVNITDASHLDAVAQMDLLDAVDADGDGRGELLFRETSDQGHAYSIYRVIGNQLYQLYESTPQ